MITRPVAVVRALLVAGVVWGLGSAATFAVFKAMGAHTTIADVSGQSHRVQIIWWGAQAFFACAGGVLGVALGGTALTSAGLAGPGSAAGWASVPVLVGGAGVLAAINATEVIGRPLALACLVGLVIGVAGGATYVIESGTPDDLDVFRNASGRRTGQSWGSR